ncbi:gluconate 2-dehydrogenase subunit 3 family protein [Bordetella genomosp. 13]|uniref:Gluconate 2-dehydrogenase n=1 Tax=Bordetella genomosp. 13 TaxID=463040 RepID=A0A1W6ZI37_9BORD|nr:gluconate 2-dehydrogenase subunit 3 family protein [Bordetella genomosp. 13]ARP97026.1 gluconate 2-dehydrogenase [Bordetella genomosp. 13]
MDEPSIQGRRGLLKAITLAVPGAWLARGQSAAAQQAAAPTAAPGQDPSAAGQPPAAANDAQGPRTGTVATPANRTLKFFNKQEAEAIDAIVARLIPADDLGPGAKEAGVTTFLDEQLAGAWGAGDQFYRSGPFEEGTAEQGYQLSFTPAEMFRRGLAELDAATRKQDGKPFAELDEGTQDEWLRLMQSGKADFSPLPSDIFFQALMDGAVEGFFSDPQYGGNVDMVGWKLVGFPGAYASFSTDIERHGVIWAGQPVSIAMAKPHQMDHGAHDPAQSQPSSQPASPPPQAPGKPQSSLQPPEPARRFGAGPQHAAATLSQEAAHG